MAHALTVGVDVGIYGRLATRDHILELAELAESSGLESIWVADHVIFPTTVASTYPYNIGEARTGVDGSRDAGTGSQAEIVDDLRRLVDLGYRRIIVRYQGSDAEQ